MKYIFDMDKWKKGGFDPTHQQFTETSSCQVCQTTPAIWITEPNGMGAYFCKEHNPLSELFAPERKETELGLSDFEKEFIEMVKPLVQATIENRVNKLRDQ